MTTFPTSDPGKAIVQDAAIEIAVNDLSHIRAKEAILIGKALIIDLLQRFEMVLNTLIILGVLWFAGLVYGRGVGHDRSLSKEDPRVSDKKYCK